MLRIGTRGSQLALKQADWVKARLEARFSGIRADLKKIKTTGDKILDVPLARVGGKGLFVKEIEEALLREDIDLAVHSMKDVPAALPEGLHLGAVAEREDPRDVLISAGGRRLEDLPRGARIGTSSLRRQAQLLNFRPDLRVVQLRGNLNTRLRKLGEEGLEGIVLAAAGLGRMGWMDRATQFLPFEVSLPAVGQGALGIECRVSDRDTNEKVAALNHPETRCCVRAERSFLKRLEGGCQVPVAAHASLAGGTLRLQGMIASLDGRRLVRESQEGSPGEAEALGLRVAEKLLSLGGEEILREIFSGLAGEAAVKDIPKGNL